MYDGSSRYKRCDPKGRPSGMSAASAGPTARIWKCPVHGRESLALSTWSSENACQTRLTHESLSSTTRCSAVAAILVQPLSLLLTHTSEPRHALGARKNHNTRCCVKYFTRKKAEIFRELTSRLYRRGKGRLDPSRDKKWTQTPEEEVGQ